MQVCVCEYTILYIEADMLVFMIPITVIKSGPPAALILTPVSTILHDLLCVNSISFIDDGLLYWDTM